MQKRSTRKLREAIKSARIIIARAGYSTIMDMYFLGRQIWLVPTPGQTEQLYLAKYHRKRGHYYASQNNLFDKVKNTNEEIYFRTSPIIQDRHYQSLLEKLNSLI